MSDVASSAPSSSRSSAASYSRSRTNDRPIALDDRQLAQLQSAAALLPPNRRDIFLRSVAGHLDHRPPTRNELRDAITFVLGNLGVSRGLSPRQPKTKEMAK